MANAKDISAEENPSILLFGDSGTHKTYFLCGVPDIYVFDFDKGMATVRGRDVEFSTFKDAPSATFTSGVKLKAPSMEKEGIFKYGTAWPAFINKLNEVGERIDQGERIPIGLDSISTMLNICMNYVLKQAAHTGAPQIQHWGAQMQLMETVMDQLTAWPVPVVVTAHVQRNTNDLTEMIEMLPLITGKLAGKIGIYFDEVYLADVKGKGDKKSWTLQTESYGLAKQVKTRYGVKDGTPTEWEAVYKQIAGKSA